MSTSAGSAWGSPLGRRLRGLIHESPTVLPPLGHIIDSVREELERAAVLGVLLVRVDHFGLASHLFSWEDLVKVYEGMSRAAADMKGRGLRKLDIPADPGLGGEAFTVILSAPRSKMELNLPLVERVARRLEDALTDQFARSLPAELFDRLSLVVGCGLITRPVGEDSLEEALANGLVEAERSARSRYLETLIEMGEEVEQVLENRSLKVVFQPILDTVGRFVVGFDATPVGPFELSLRLSDVFFDAATRTGLSYRAYDLYHEKALEVALTEVSSSDLLILRVGGSELVESAVRVVSLLYRTDAHRLTPDNILFLVGPGQTAAQFAASRMGFASVKEMGFKLGIDVVSDRPMPLDYWHELSPDLLRISGRMAHRIKESPDGLELALMLSRFAHRHGGRLLVADCKDNADVAAAIRAGADLIQGDAVAPSSHRPTVPDTAA